MPTPELKHLFLQAQKGAQLIEPENWKVQCFEQRNLESLGTYEENTRIKFIYKKRGWVQLRQNSLSDWETVKINSLQKTLLQKKCHGAAVE